MREVICVREDDRLVQCGDTEVYETYFTTVKEAFKYCQKEYGRCAGHIYHDDVDGPIGWIFQKTARYEDTNEPFKQETWVELHEAVPTRTIKYHYLSI